MALADNQVMPVEVNIEDCPAKKNSLISGEWSLIRWKKSAEFWRQQRRCRLICRLAELLLVLVFVMAQEFYPNLPCQRCLPPELLSSSLMMRSSEPTTATAPRSNSIFVACFALQVTSESRAPDGGGNTSASTTTTTIPIMSVNSSTATAIETTTTTTLAPDNATVSTQPTSSDKAINKHRQRENHHPIQLQLHNVLCNSRCQCLVLESGGDSSVQANQSNDTNYTNDKPAAAAKGANDERQQKQQDDNNSVATPSDVEQTLIAFTEDFSLDYDDNDNDDANDNANTANGNAANNNDTDATSQAPEQADGSGVPSESLITTTTTPNSVAAVEATGNGVELQARNNRSNTTLRGETAAAAISGAAKSNSNNNNNNNNNTVNVAVSKTTKTINMDNKTLAALSAPGRADILNGPSATRTKQRQPSAAPTSQLQPLPLFPLHHLHHHLHHGAAGSAGRDSSGPQLYAQSLYSSQAPKLSYHAHAPYLKSSLPPPSSSLSSSQPSAGQQQSAQQPATRPQADGVAAPSGSAPHYHSLRTNHRLRINGAATGVKTSPALASAPIKRLIPLNLLRMDRKLVAPKIHQVKNKTQEQQLKATKNSLDSRHLAEILAQMLRDIDEQSIQSLSLRDNDLQFELWSELYALLTIKLRTNLYHLDLSHNSLAKLGLTFTGHLEHHLIVHGTWPFSSIANDSSSSAVTTSAASGEQQTTTSTNDNDIAQQRQQPNKLSKSELAAKPRQLARHQSLLSGDRLYSLVKKILAIENVHSSLLLNASNVDQVMAINPNNVTALQQPIQLRAVNLSHNKLKWLINDQFRALKHVHSIRLDYNRIRYIHQHAFSGLESLRFLNLNFNRLQVIYIEQFQTNFNLLTLMLRSNYLAYLRGGSFASQVNLRRLDLSQNKLTIMSNNAFVGLESLELLNCSSNQFVHAPTASLHPLTNLRQLDLSDNLIAELAPGTFFHLPIEELWLERNEQLVSIDRGAFWDLPYLRQLHLSSNPMLMSINPQAFVGSQNLQKIDTDNCPSLEPGARRLLDNITMVAASRRLLRQEQHLQLQQTVRHLNHTNPALQSSSQLRADQDQTRTILPVERRINATGDAIAPIGKVDNDTLTKTSEHQHQQTALSRQFATGSMASGRSVAAGRTPMQIHNSKAELLKYFYYLATITSLVVALKLVFKYTSTSYLMEARRRRRRVYGESSGAEFGGSGAISSSLSTATTTSDSTSAESSASSSYEMCERPGAAADQYVIGAVIHRGRAQTEGVIADGDAISRRTSAISSDLGDELSPANGFVSVDEQLAAGSLPAPTGPSESGDINVISEMVPQLSGLSQSSCCLECPAGGQVQNQEQSVSNVAPGAAAAAGSPMQQPVALGQTSTIDLIHSQLVAAGFDYGHANCAHFYQSLGPALQLADMTANFVNGMDYY